VPDHPWVDSADGAAVRIAMTVGAMGVGEGRLLIVTDEQESGGDGLEVHTTEQNGVIHADLTIGANVSAVKTLQANGGLSNRGVIPHGAGMLVTPEEASRLDAGAPIKPYRNGKDLTDRPRGVLVIDCYGYSAEQVRTRFPLLYQWLLDRVKPERDASRDKDLREKWWLHRRNNEDLRRSLASLPRYIATGQTAKHRVFQFLDASILPDDKLIAIALDDAYFLGVLSSHVHVVWALAAGGWLGVGNDPVYNKSRCFDAFPFPAATPEQQACIRDLAEQIDAHRKRQQAAHAELTLTGMYNVLEKLKVSLPMTAKEKAIHEMGLVSVLKSLHDELDAAVLDAYGWQDLLPSPACGRGAGGEGDEAILERLVALNAARATEEANGQVRWLRPAFQHPEARPVQGEMDVGAGLPAMPAPIAGKPAPTEERQTWPATLPEQVAAVARVLAEARAPLAEAELAARFTGKGPWKKRLPQLLDTLVALGRARQSGGGWTGA